MTWLEKRKRNAKIHHGLQHPQSTSSSSIQLTVGSTRLTCKLMLSVWYIKCSWKEALKMACTSPQTATASTENASSLCWQKRNIFYSDLRSRILQNMRHKQHGQQDIYMKFLGFYSNFSPVVSILFYGMHQFSRLLWLRSLALYTQIHRLQNIQNSSLRMSRKYPRTIALNFLHADFSVVELADYLQLLATSTQEIMTSHSNELTRQLCAREILGYTFATKWAGKAWSS